MEIYQLEQDLKVFCVEAHSFPHDIAMAFEELVSRIGTTEGRTFFGVSYQTTGGIIIYKAAVLESFPHEGRMLGSEEDIIPG